MIYSFLKVRRHIKDHTGAPDALTALLLLIMHSAHQLDAAFIQWKELGISTLGEFYLDRQFASFEQLSKNAVFYPPIFYATYR